MLLDCSTLFQINPEVHISSKDVFGHKILIIDNLLTEECFENLQKATDAFPRTLFLDNPDGSASCYYILVYLINLLIYF